MDSFKNSPDIILDLIFLKLNEENLHETLRVSKSWFWASIRRTKKLKITWADNPLKSMVEFYNNHRPPNEKMDCLDLFKHLVLDELIVIRDTETTQYLVNNGCNTAELTIQTSAEEEVPVTLASLKTITRLQSFEFRNNWEMKWQPFIVECMKSSDCEFEPNIECQIEAIKLNARGWNPGDPVLKLVTKLGLSDVDIDFLRKMVDLCPNLEELYCIRGVITEDWRQVFPENVKRIELDRFRVDSDVATVVHSPTDSGRHLLPYLCQKVESVEKFKFNDYINLIGETVNKAFRQQREEVFICERFNEAVNLGSSLFQSREIHVKCGQRNALQLTIPPTKSVKFEFGVWCDLKFSPRDVCEEPGKVEHMSLLLIYAEDINPEPFGPNSFEGFTRLTSLTLSDVNALTIKMVLDQCPSIRKIELQYLKAFTIGSMPSESSYANVCELVLEGCEETVRQVFKVFPNLTYFKQSASFDIYETFDKKTDWLSEHLITTDKRYGLVFGKRYEITKQCRYMVSDDLQGSLSHAQQLLKEYMHKETVFYLKGFKLIPRVRKQEVIYVD